MCDQLKFVDTKEGEIKDMNVIKSVSADERQRESREGEKSEKGEETETQRSRETKTHGNIL